MKFAEEVMEILEAFDLTQSYRTAAELADCAHNPVARYVAAREAGGLSARPVHRAQLLDSYLEKIEEWVEGSRGRLRADVAHEKLLAAGRYAPTTLGDDHRGRRRGPAPASGERPRPARRL